MRTAIFIAGLMIADRIDRDKKADEWDSKVYNCLGILFVCFVIMDIVDFFGGL